MLDIFDKKSADLNRDLSRWCVSSEDLYLLPDYSI